MPPPLRLGLLLALAAILFWNLWSAPILSHNEARRMVVAQEILRSGQWLLPTMNGELYITKPPLYTWLQALLAKLTGSTAPGVLRLPSTLSAVALLVALFRFVTRHEGRQAAWLAVLVLGTSQLFVLHARNAEIEMLLTLWCALALMLAWDHLRLGGRWRLAAAWACQGLAILTKGPVALLFFVPPVLVYGALVERRAWRLLTWPPGWLICLGVALPWYLYVWLHVDRAVIDAILQRDILAKVHRKGGAPFYSYLGVIAGGFLPWLAVFFLPGRRTLAALRARPLEAWLAAGSLVPLVILSMFSAKHGKYALPMFPILAAWTGLRLADWGEQAAPRARRLFQATAVVMLAGTLAFHAWLAPVVWKHRHQALPSIVARLEAETLPVYAYRARPIQLIYLLGRPVPVVDAEGLAALRRSSRPFLLLADSRYESDPALAGLRQVAHWPVYLKKRRGLGLYRFEPDKPAPVPAPERR